MKKFGLYPLWRVDEFESFLNKQELEGWRLNSIKYSCIFDFTLCKSKCSDYIVTYNMAKDRTPCMYQYELELLSLYSANKVPSKATGYSVFRVTGKNRDFSSLKSYRKKYFKHVLFQYLLISTFFLFLGLLMLLASILQKVSGIALALTICYVLLSLAIFLYRTHGYISYIKTCNTI